MNHAPSPPEKKNQQQQNKTKQNKQTKQHKQQNGKYVEIVMILEPKRGHRNYLDPKLQSKISKGDILWMAVSVLNSTSDVEKGVGQGFKFFPLLFATLFSATGTALLIHFY